MKNELLKIGPITLYGYGLMIAIGIIAAYLVSEYRAKKMGLNSEKVFGLAIWAAVGGILGAKILFFITVIPQIIAYPKMIVETMGTGFVVFGGIIFGSLAGYIYCKKEKLDFLAYFDLVMPAVALAQGFGRIGCFLAGCCWGVETTSPIGIIFHESQFAPNGVALVPTQLISSGLNFLHFLVLIWFAKRKKADGQVGGAYLILYSIGRFIIEFFRGDLERGSVGALSTSQFIALFTAAIGIVIFVVCTKRGKKVEAEA